MVAVTCNFECSVVKARKTLETLIGFLLHQKAFFVKGLIIAAVWMIYSLPLIVFHTTNPSAKVMCAAIYVHS